ERARIIGATPGGNAIGIAKHDLDLVETEPEPVGEYLTIGGGVPLAVAVAADLQCRVSVGMNVKERGIPLAQAGPPPALGEARAAGSPLDEQADADTDEASVLTKPRLLVAHGAIVG